MWAGERGNTVSPLCLHLAQEGLFAMTSRVRKTSIAVLMVGVLLTAEGLTWAADKAVMRPRVPRDQIEAAAP